MAQYKVKKNSLILKNFVKSKIFRLITNLA